MQTFTSIEAQEKLHQLIITGKQRAGEVINTIMRDAPSDALVPAPAMTFVPTAKSVCLVVAGTEYSLHRNAFSQAHARVDIPASYVSHLQAQSGDWGRELLAHNLNKTWANKTGRVLTRAVGSEVRGILSDRYRRIDSRPIVEAIATAAQAKGMVPIDGYAMQVKNSLKLVLPTIFEVTPGEHNLLGFSWSNSDYGVGFNTMSLFWLRLICLNGMTRANVMREVHLGRQMTDAIFSERTHQLDTQTSVSAIKDMIEGYLSPAKVEEQILQLRAAMAKPVEPAAVDGMLKAVGLQKEQVKAVKEVYTSADIEKVPAGNSVYRLANALSWVANEQDDRMVKLDMMRSAGEILDAAV